MKLALLGLAFGLAGNLFAYLLSLAKKKVSKSAPKSLLSCSFRKCRLNLSSFDFVEGTLYRSWNEFDCFKCWWWDHLSIGLALEIALDRLYPISWFPGGEVTPLFAIGASLGAVLAPVLGLPIPLVAGLGYLSVFGSSTNTLLAPIFIGVEVFGPANALPYAIVMAFAYLINHKTSIYGQQKMLEM